ncbi:MAG: Flp pilus assembly protein CpaB [Hyphomicrobiaceae bacterium]
MKRAQLIGLSIALGAGVLAVVVAKSFMRPPPAPKMLTRTVDAVKVLVAKADIPIGQVASEASFRWQEWPKAAVSPSFITNTAKPRAPRDFSGHIARSRILQGEPITKSKLIKAGSGGVLAALLSPGMRAISVKISEHTSVGRLILPNDHVDMLLTTRSRTRNGGAEDVTSEPLLSNVRVLAIGQNIEVREGKRTADGNVATLEVSPGQAETIAQAGMRGEITLILRSIADIGAVQAGVTRKETGNSVRVLRFGVRSRAYGVN